jgi:xanthine dehydrogenase YagR molybdenum-binding subunit
VFSATCDMGPGTYTSMTQVAADALGLSLQRVRFSLGDSQFPKAPSHSGSRTMASVGSAVFVTSNSLRDKFIRTAVVDPGSPLIGATPQNITVAAGRMYRTDDPARGETYQELLRRRGWASLDTQQTWTPDDADKRFSIYAYGAVFAEVGVDESLGRVRIRRIFGCYDGGRITLDATFLPGEDTVADPIGVKGLGELVIVAVPPAIANAVFNATGKRITDLPITLDKLL